MQFLVGRINEEGDEAVLPFSRNNLEHRSFLVPFRTQNGTFLFWKKTVRKNVREISDCHAGTFALKLEDFRKGVKITQNDQINGTF